MPRRTSTLLVTAGGLLAAGLLYAGFYAAFGVGIPCVFHLVTGLYCPGCGISRMCIALLRLDIAAAFRSNFGVMLSLPALAVFFGWQAASYLKTGSWALGKGQTRLLWALIAFLLVFALLRNLPPFAFLRPAT